LQNERSSQILERLQSGVDIRLQLYCKCRHDVRSQTSKQNKTQILCELFVVVYGKSSASELVGRFLQDCHICLQDPAYCDRNVPYRNPHLLLEDDHVMTGSLHAGERHSQNFETPSDVFDQFYTTNEHDEAKTPSTIITPLHQHQKQALAFMLRRERGWDFERSSDELWTKLASSNGEYLNNITGEYCSSIPPNFLGGIIADQMGLGKTLQMIALIASDLEYKGRTPSDFSLEPHFSLQKCHSTLVIVPVSLLQTWSDQLQWHLRSNSLHWHIFHGARRKCNVTDLLSSNIVLTTYDIVLSEWKSTTTSPGKASLFSVLWRRIVLDEGAFPALQFAGYM
jgi:SNF2 family DNA or RNA helicase